MGAGQLFLRSLWKKCSNYRRKLKSFEADNMDEEQIKLLIGEVISHWRTLFDQLSPEQQKIRAKPYLFWCS